MKVVQTNSVVLFDYIGKTGDGEVFDTFSDEFVDEGHRMIMH